MKWYFFLLGGKDPYPLWKRVADEHGVILRVLDRNSMPGCSRRMLVFSTGIFQKLC